MTPTRRTILAVAVVVAAAVGFFACPADEREAPPPAEPLGGAESRPDDRSDTGSGVQEPEDTASLAPRLLRADVYRSISEQQDMEEARKIAIALLELLRRDHPLPPKETKETKERSEGIGLVEGDLEAAIGRDDLVTVAGAALVLAEATRGPDALLDDAGLLPWIDAIALSELAANAVVIIFDRAQRFTDDHLARLLGIVRAGLPDDRRRECARRLFELHVALHGDAAPYLALLADANPYLRAIAVEALVRIDVVRYESQIWEAAEIMPPEEKGRVAQLILGRLEPAVAADRLSELHRRWPDTRLTGAWTDLGFRDGEIILSRLAREDDSNVRRQMLMGWVAQGADPASAERAIIEVIDNDPDAGVRAQGLLALGQVDTEGARNRLADESRKEGDSLQIAHVSGGIQNALARAPKRWVLEVAIPFARRKIAGSQDPEHERRMWRETLERTHPDAVGALDHP